MVAWHQVGGRVSAWSSSPGLDSPSLLLRLHLSLLLLPHLPILLLSQPPLLLLPASISSPAPVSPSFHAPACLTFVSCSSLPHLTLLFLSASPSSLTPASLTFIYQSSARGVHLHFNPFFSSCNAIIWLFNITTCKPAYSWHMLGCQPSAATRALQAPQRPFGPILRIL